MKGLSITTAWKPGAILLALVLGGHVLTGARGAGAQGPVDNTITFQGQLTRNGALVSRDDCDFQFGMFDAASGGSQLGDTIELTEVPMIDGYFTVNLDFGAHYTGAGRFLEVGVTCPPDTAGRYVTLDRRFDLNATPYALHAGEVVSAGSVTTATTALAATNVTTAQVATHVNWTQIQNRPFGLDDGDDDALATACPGGSAYNGYTVHNDGAGGWACEEDTDVDTLADLKGYCTADEIVAFDGTTWGCTSDQSSTYSASTGLTMGGTILSVRLDYRMPLTCTDQYTAKWNDTDRKWFCAVDRYTTYTAGDGINASALLNSLLKVQVANISGDGLEDDTNNKFRVVTADLAGEGITADTNNNLAIDASALAGTNMAASATNDLEVDAETLGGVGLSEDSQGRLKVDATELAGDGTMASGDYLAVDASELAGVGLAGTGSTLQIATDGVGMREMNVPMGAADKTWEETDDDVSTYTMWPVINSTVLSGTKCMVIATATLRGTGDSTGSEHAYVQAAWRSEGGSVHISGDNIRAYFGDADPHSNASVSWVFTVRELNPVDFGCRYIAPDSSWHDDEDWACTVSYFCQ